MKKARILILFLTISLLCVLCALPASAAARKELTLSLVVRENAQFERDSADPAFWEWPALSAGQSLTGGQLVLRNTSAYDVQFSLDAVELPYEDVEMVPYLNAITLVIRLGEEELFHDRFAKLDGFHYDFGTLAAEESRTLSIDMHCDFAYTGKVTSVKEAVCWTFSAQSGGTALEVVPDTTLPVEAVALGAGAAVVVGVCLLLKYLPRRKK